MKTKEEARSLVTSILDAYHDWMSSEKDLPEQEDYILQLLPHLEQLLADKRRLDAWEKTKEGLHASWREGGWNNPSVRWSIQVSVEDGTYVFPQSLKDLTLRTAIDNVMEKTK